MRWIVETIGGCWELFLLGWRSRFRLRGRYWAWRRETAFGTHNQPDRATRIREAVQYGRWVFRMKRL